MGATLGKAKQKSICHYNIMASQQGTQTTVNELYSYIKLKVSIALDTHAPQPPPF